VNSTELERMRARAALALRRHIEPMYAEGARITLVVRMPGADPEAYVVLTNDDDLAALRAIIERACSEPSP
jgi:hypothetical protein